MFTGIVQSQAQVISVNKSNNFAQIVVNVPQEWAGSLLQGASIAVNGVCLTVVKHEIINKSAYITFEVIDETLAVSNLDRLVNGSIVNFERSLKVGDEIGGHQVSGHVHTRLALDSKTETSDSCKLVFSCEEQWLKYVLPKGFITVNGVSLTVGEVDKNSFAVHLIPETLSRTNLSTLTNGDCVNIEFDQQTITIVTTLARMKAQQLLN